MSESIEEFCDTVDAVAKEVSDILSGRIDVKVSEEKEAYKKKQKEEKERQQKELIIKGREGKGIKFDKYLSYCKSCMREYELETPKCVHCNRDTISSEDRKRDLHEKVEEYKKQKAQKAENKLRWENWKKTEAMLYKKNSTNYKKWEFFEDEDEEEPQPEFIPPENDPNFIALENDIKERGERRRKDLAAANELKEKGNEFYKQGKNRNAIAKYEEAIEIKKDMMTLYTNCAAARLKVDDYDGAIRDCARVIEYFEVFDKEFESNKEVVFKAYYRRGEAHKGKKMLTEALFDYEKAFEIKPEKELEKILERCREEAEESGVTAITEEIQDSADIIQNLDSDEKIQMFRISGGYQVLFKRVYESMDANALVVLEFLIKDDTRFIDLQPFVLPLYDKRQTAAIIMLETLTRYKSDEDFSTRVCKIIALCIENSHIRDEVAKHSANTKGKKFYKVVLEIFNSSPCYMKVLIPIISNLCLTTQKTSLQRKPNPGNMKSLIKSYWNSSSKVIENMMSVNLTEILGLLCNISVKPKLKRHILSNTELVKKSIAVCESGTKSLDVERAIGLLINLLTQPTDSEKMQAYSKSIWSAILRLFNLETYIEILEERNLKLLFRLLISTPSLIESLSKEKEIIKFLTERLESQNADTIVKILATASSSKAFVENLDIKAMSKSLSGLIQRFMSGEKIDERIGNLCLAVGRCVGCVAEYSLEFTELIPGLVGIIKEKLGPVRKNVAVCLGKVCNNETNKEVMRSVHGLEVLSSVMSNLN